MTLWHKFLVKIGVRCPTWVLVQEAADPYWHQIHPLSDTQSRGWSWKWQYRTRCGRWERFDNKSYHKLPCPTCMSDVAELMVDLEASKALWRQLGYKA